MASPGRGSPRPDRGARGPDRGARGPDRGSDRPLLDKLGVRPGATVAVLSLPDPTFEGLLRTRTDDVTLGPPRPGTDLVFVYVGHRDDLDAAIEPLEGTLRRNGAIWVIRPKGTADIKETDVIDAGKRAGLVDNKIASFSPTLSAMRLVIPLARR
jgi:hypothetical protein